MVVNLLDTLIDPIAPISFTKLGYKLRSGLANWEDLSNTKLTIAITGPTSGLGRQLAIELDAMGANLILVARNEAKLESLLTELPGKDKHSTILCDLTKPASIQSACKELNGLENLDVLVHNAGTIFDSHSFIDGSEQTLFSHVIAPFALSAAANRALATSDSGRVIYVASGGLYTQAVDIDDLDLAAKPKDFNGTRAYARAKRIQTIITSEASKESPKPIQLAAHPGWVDTPGLEKLLPGFHKLLKPVLRTPSQGVDTIRWLATTSVDNLTNGAFYHDREPRSTSYIPGTHTSPSDSKEIYEIVKARAAKLTN